MDLHITEITCESTCSPCKPSRQQHPQILGLRIGQNINYLSIPDYGKVSPAQSAGNISQQSHHVTHMAACQPGWFETLVLQQQS